MCLVSTELRNTGEATIVSMHVSVVSSYAVLVCVAGADAAPAVPAHLLLAIYSQSKQAVASSLVWTVVRNSPVLFSPLATRPSHSPGRLRGCFNRAAGRGEGLARAEWLMMTAVVPRGAHGAPRVECLKQLRRVPSLAGGQLFGLLSRPGCARGCGGSGPGFWLPFVHLRLHVALAARSSPGGPLSARAEAPTMWSSPVESEARVGPRSAVGPRTRGWQRKIPGGSQPAPELPRAI